MARLYVCRRGCGAHRLRGSHCRGVQRDLRRTGACCRRAVSPNAQPVHRLDRGASWSVPRERRDAPTMSAAGTEPWESTSYIWENNIGMLATTSPNASMSESVGRHGAGSAQVRGVSEVTAAEKPRASIATAIRPA